MANPHPDAKRILFLASGDFRQASAVLATAGAIAAQTMREDVQITIVSFEQSIEGTFTERFGQNPRARLPIERIRRYVGARLVVVEDSFTRAVMMCHEKKPKNWIVIATSTFKLHSPGFNNLSEHQRHAIGYESIGRIDSLNKQWDRYGPPQGLRKVLISSAPDLDSSLSVYLPHQVLCGPILRPVSPVSKALRNWLARGPTLFVDLSGTPAEALQVANELWSVLDQADAVGYRDG
ncbi:hypothetical protein B0H66DRAFT_626358 [Apodospora peruviana]|uniref:Uncharacterized protein n=1 Tax=Apodospora peruviana TaxID=516989 RepID=A0AAE0I1Q0_9PEZI|nr:hypothetical protein B0H66DRAFT_626358 [Apodospora peruviana]